jgi:hypothetical protein
MCLTGIRRRRHLTRVILFAFVAFYPIANRAQEPVRTKAPAPRTIVLPQKLVTDAQATLAVMDPAGRMLPDVIVQLPGDRRVTTDKTGRALFIAPSDVGMMTAKIPGQEITASALVVKLPPPDPQAASVSVSTPLRMVAYPHFLTLHDRFTIEGEGFRGEANADHVFLADQACLVLASSPISLVVLPGLHVPIGEVSLRVDVAGQEAGPNPVAMVLLELSGPAEAPNAGVQNKLLVFAHGTRERLAVEVRNGSPEVIQLLRGNVERVTTSGGEPNLAAIDAKFIAPGDYMVTARLIPTDSGLPDMEAARQKLVAARALATGSWAARADRLIRRIDRAPQDYLEIRTQLRQMLDDKPLGEFAMLIESAWQEFSKN